MPPDTFIEYQVQTGVAPPAEETTERAELPQHYADMFGWDEMAEKVTLAISEAARTGKIGDGKVFVYEMQDAVRIRTGERGDTALT